MTEVGLRPNHTTMFADNLRSLRRFDWLMTTLALWFIGGLFLDGWAHTHGQVDESFFTPWHAVLYSGHAAILVTLIVHWVRAHALSQGYRLSMVGAVLYLFAGVGDFLWHDAFGVEESIEALLSPTHLILAISAFLIVTGTLRASWPNAATGLIATGRRLRPGFRPLLRPTPRACTRSSSDARWRAPAGHRQRARHWP